MTAFAPFISSARARARLWALVAACTLLLSACGFALRQPPVMPFRTMTLSKFSANSPLASELARALEASGVDVIEPPVADPKYHVILEATTDSRDQVVATSTSSGQVRELNLRTRFGFRLLRADGSVLLPATELSLTRELTYNEQDALSKDNESTALHRDMQTDIVSQALRRLAAVQMR
jgi:LPS-assembly lipoprotein